MPTELERKARAILRDVYAKRGDWAVGNAALNGTLSVHDDETVVTAIVAALQAQQPGAQAVGTLTIEHFRGSAAMENFDLDYFGTLAPGSYAIFTHPQPPSIPEPSAEHWRMAIKERGIENPKALDWIEQRARQMAKAGQS